MTHKLETRAAALEELRRVAEREAQALHRVQMEDGYEDEFGVERAEAWIAADDWVIDLNEALERLEVAGEDESHGR